jgi:hypothetical protein
MAVIPLLSSDGILAVLAGTGNDRIAGQPHHRANAMQIGMTLRREMAVLWRIFAQARNCCVTI